MGQVQKLEECQCIRNGYYVSEGWSGGREEVAIEKPQLPEIWNYKFSLGAMSN